MNANPDDEPYATISSLENTFEAQLLTSILTERDIPHRIRSHHDTAYDGLFQTQMGWGEIFAPARFKLEIFEIIKNIRNQKILQKE